MGALLLCGETKSNITTVWWHKEGHLYYVCGGSKGGITVYKTQRGTLLLCGKENGVPVWWHYDCVRHREENCYYVGPKWSTITVWVHFTVQGTAVDTITLVLVWWYYSFIMVMQGQDIEVLVGNSLVVLFTHYVVIKCVYDVAE